MFAVWLAASVVLQTTDAPPAKHIRATRLRSASITVDGRLDEQVVWEAKATIDGLGWTAEMRIPFSQLRFTDQPVQVWGFNVDHWNPATSEDVFWIAVPRNRTGWSSFMGELVGIEGIKPTRRLELMPYAAADSRLESDVAAADPFN